MRLRLSKDHFEMALLLLSEHFEIVHPNHYRLPAIFHTCRESRIIATTLNRSLSKNTFINFALDWIVLNFIKLWMKRWYEPSPWEIEMLGDFTPEPRDLDYVKRLLISMNAENTMA